MKQQDSGWKWRMLVGALSVLLLTACGGGGKQTDTPTRGEIKVSIDDSYRLLMEAEIYAFETIYKYASIDTAYKTEGDVFEDFMNDSVPLIVVNRKLTDQEHQILSSRLIVPKTTPIAYDAIAFIINNENPSKKIFFDKIKGIFKGTITTWQQIDPASTLGDIRVVFDHYRSGNPRYFKEKFGLDSLPQSCYAVQDNRQVISYVETHSNALGVISVNWISDYRDSVSNDFLNRITVVGIGPEGDNEPGASFYKPYQAYIAEGFYPFTRTVYCINRQTYAGLAFGLSAYVACDKGQLIVLHAGLVPATMPVRIVEIKH